MLTQAQRKAERSGSFPLMNLAEEFGLPVGVVWTYADCCRKVMLDHARAAPLTFADPRHIEAYREVGLRLDADAALRFHDVVNAQVRAFLETQGITPPRRPSSPKSSSDGQDRDRRHPDRHDRSRLPRAERRRQGLGAA